MATKKKRNAFLAALLNFFIWGLGYLYSGKSQILGIGLLAAWLISTAYFTLVLNLPPLPQSPYDNAYASAGMLLILSQFIMSLAFAYDVYVQTKK